MNEAPEKIPEKIPEKKPSLRKRIEALSPLKKVGFIAGILLLVGASAYFAYDQYKYESTDDAYVQAYSTQISPKVSGIVTHVLVAENQHVNAGQILVQIDQKDYIAALQDSLALLGSLEAQYKNASQDFERMKMLILEKAISQQSFDRAKANFLNLQRQTKAAEARVVESRLNLQYTSIRAPADGMIARRSVDTGMYAAAGTAVLGFVPSDERWIDANFKETQLSSIVRGRPAKITVDAIDGKTYEGIVESISPATGATFTLLPPDNATGNFTKVVQRVPVRIFLKNLTPADVALLHAGLSAEVDILKHGMLEALPAPAPAIYAASDIGGAPAAAQTGEERESEQAGVSGATTSGATTSGDNEDAQMGE
jgi:membrane fusion protein (multidrug efflux system)